MDKNIIAEFAQQIIDASIDNGTQPVNVNITVTTSLNITEDQLQQLSNFAKTSVASPEKPKKRRRL
jgi:hypothetical protein